MTISQKETLLIVDDVAASLEIMSNILSADYNLKVAKSGKKALELARKEPLPNLILLDVKMPEMCGLETCRLLKTNPLCKNIPVIFVTIQTDMIDEAKGFAVGGVDYITKPVNPTIVRARVKTHLALSAATRELTLQNQKLQANIKLLQQIEQIARHDLKGPLTVFMGASDYMGFDKNLTPEQLDFLKILDEALLKMLNMIDSSLNLFKMERGQYKVEPVPVDVVKLVGQIYTELDGLARTRSVECQILLNNHILCDTDSCIIQSEANLLSIILSNLVKNAIEASSEGEKVTISLFEQNPFLIEIHNQAVIPDEIRSRFFERYVTHGKEKGTGLGGYSARLAVKTLGGNINFKTSKENGTVISVSIPQQQKKLKADYEHRFAKHE